MAGARVTVLEWRVWLSLDSGSEWVQVLGAPGLQVQLKLFGSALEIRSCDGTGSRDRPLPGPLTIEKLAPISSP